jgi:hypothetical protein
MSEPPTAAPRKYFELPGFVMYTFAGCIILTGDVSTFPEEPATTHTSPLNGTMPAGLMYGFSIVPGPSCKMLSGVIAVDDPYDPFTR